MGPINLWNPRINNLFLYFSQQELVRERDAQPREALARRVGVVHEAAREDHCPVGTVRHDRVQRAAREEVKRAVPGGAPAGVGEVEEGEVAVVDMRRALLQRRLAVGVDPLHRKRPAEPLADQPEEVLAKERLRLEPVHVPEAVGRPAASEAPARALHLEQHVGLRVDRQEVVVHLDPSSGRSECAAAGEDDSVDVLGGECSAAGT